MASQPLPAGHDGAGGLRTVAALYVETGGCYFGLPGVEVVGHGEDHADGSTTVRLDGRSYRGRLPVVAHPSCKRFGRFWHGSTAKPHQFKLGDDGGCFEHALDLVRENGGVIEHPCDSKAWELFGLNRPPRGGGWVRADDFGGWTCCVDQGHYGHFANKLTWLYVCGVEPEDLPELVWGKGEQRLHPVALERHGYAKARRIGMMAMIGGKDKVRIRNATPEPFRDLLLSIARSATPAAGNQLSQPPAVSARPDLGHNPSRNDAEGLGNSHVPHGITTSAEGQRHHGL